MPTPSDEVDPSNGWEAVAQEVIVLRQLSMVGVATVQAWARTLPEGASILDLGCGSGQPISDALISDGFAVYGVDASPSLAAAFRHRFPHAHIACEAVEESSFFGRTFDGAVAWGLMFLLPIETQRAFIHRVARALNAGGRFLFTAPAQVCSWADLSTGRLSQSLGAAAYEAELAAAGLRLLGKDVDEGENHYYKAEKR
jgi:SAM-dependent methyltransferase